jgi:predicted Zn-dependent peptidase
VAHVEASLKSEIRRAIDEGFLDGEVASARDGWLARRRLERSSDPVLAAQLNGQLRTGGSFDNAAQLEASMAGIDGVRVKRVVEQYLDLGKMSIVRSGDYRQ